MNLLYKYKKNLANYFDLLTNQINRKADDLIAKECLDKTAIYEINFNRKAFLNEIKEIERSNLKRFDEALVNGSPDELGDLGEEALNERIHSRFCFLLEARDVQRQVAGRSSEDHLDWRSIFGYLFVTECYVTKEEIFYFKEFLKYVDVEEALSHENFFFTFANKNVNFSLVFF